MTNKSKMDTKLKTRHIAYLAASALIIVTGLVLCTTLAINEYNYATRPRFEQQVSDNNYEDSDDTYDDAGQDFTPDNDETDEPKPKQILDLSTINLANTYAISEVPYTFNYDTSWKIDDYYLRGEDEEDKSKKVQHYTASIDTNTGMEMYIMASTTNYDVDLEFLPEYYDYNGDEFIVLNTIGQTKLLRSKTLVAYVVDSKDSGSRIYDTSLKVDISRNPQAHLSSPDTIATRLRTIEIFATKNGQIGWNMPIFGALGKKGDYVLIQCTFDDPIDLNDPPDNLNDYVSLCDMFVQNIGHNPEFRSTY